MVLLCVPPMAKVNQAFSSDKGCIINVVYYKRGGSNCLNLSVLQRERECILSARYVEEDENGASC